MQREILFEGQNGSLKGMDQKSKEYQNEGKNETNIKKVREQGHTVRKGQQSSYNCHEKGTKWRIKGVVWDFKKWVWDKVVEW